SSGVTVTGTVPFFAGNSMIFANNLLYGSSGQVIDPTTGNLVGTFTGGGFFNTSHVIDLVNNRAIFLSNQFTFDGFSVSITAYDLNTFLPVGSLQIRGVAG